MQPFLTLAFQHFQRLRDSRSQRETRFLENPGDRKGGQGLDDAPRAQGDHTSRQTALEREMLNKTFGARGEDAICNLARISMRHAIRAWTSLIARGYETCHLGMSKKQENANTKASCWAGDKTCNGKPANAHATRYGTDAKQLTNGAVDLVLWRFGVAFFPRNAKVSPKQFASPTNQRNTTTPSNES